MKICFIGFGNMAQAIAHNLVKNNKNNQLYAAAPSLTEGETRDGMVTHYDNKANLAQADLVILAVKPVNMATVLDEITPSLPKTCLLISIAAGLTLSWLEQHCPGHSIIRAMPNIAIAQGKGATPLFANSLVTLEQKQQVALVFANSGLISWATTENDLDVFTALSGSGPAYVFLFLEAMINAAEQLGIDKQLAKDFAQQTVAGALSLAAKSNLPISELRKKVTSPAGTTAAAIATLEQQGFEQLIYQAMKAAYDRAKQLGALAMKSPCEN